MINNNDVIQHKKDEWKPKEIKNEKLIVVEGKDEVNFITSFLKHLKIDKDEIDIFDVGGREKLRKRFKILMMARNINKVKIIGIIMDAEKNKAKSTFDMIDNLFNKINEDSTSLKNKLELSKNFSEFSPTPLRIGLYISPNNKDEGMLEDLLIKTFENTDNYKCVSAVLDCLTNKNCSLPKNISKAKMQLYLSTLEDDVTSIGIASKKQYIKFDHPELNQLKDFLLHFK